MASKTRPQFKHPIPTRSSGSVDELSWITEETLAGVKPNTGVRQFNWNGLKVIVRHLISLDEMQKLVGLVLDQCWDGERMRMELLDFHLRCAVVVFFTNVNLPQKAEEQYEYLYGTDLYETAVQYVSASQIKAIEDALKMYVSQ